MTSARPKTVIEAEPTYHCISRCVRRAYLHGHDVYTLRSYEHRKDWLKERLIFLTRVFSIETLAYAFADNHQHTLLRARPELTNAMSDTEVADRWLQLCPDRFLGQEEATRHIVSNAFRLNVLRSRLSSVSWFMKSLNEFISRRANLADQCKSRVWEGRFRCQRISGDGGIFCCAVYIDLSLIHAGNHASPEQCENTSAFERITSYKKNGHDNGLWIAPISSTADRPGAIPQISLQEYLSILDETGRHVASGRGGRIAESLDPILQRLGIDPTNWTSAVYNIGKSFAYAVGDPRFLLKAASGT